MRATPLRSLLLYALDHPKPKDPPWSLATASIVAHLRSAGVCVRPTTLGVNQANLSSAHELVQAIVSDVELHDDDGQCDVALGAYVWNDGLVRRATQQLKQAGFRGRIIAGGPQVTYAKPGELEGYFPHVDVFVRGHAEDALLHVMAPSLRGLEGADGVHVARGVDIGRIAKANLADLASPLLTGVLPASSRFIRWETQRGCPFKCTFCQHRAKEHAPTRFSHHRVLAEAEFIATSEFIRDVHVVDPTFNSGGPMHLSVLKVLAQCGFRGRIALQTRAEMIDDAFLHAVCGINASGLVVLECGLQTAVANEFKAINRPNNLRRFATNVRKAMDLGIEVDVSLIFGLPGQTVASFEQSIQFCRDLRIPAVVAFPLMLTRGTELDDAKEALGLVTAQEPAHNGIARLQGDSIVHVVSSPSFSYEDWKRMAAIAAGLSAEADAYRARRDAAYACAAQAHSS